MSGQRDPSWLGKAHFPCRCTEGCTAATCLCSLPARVNSRAPGASSRQGASSMYRVNGLSAPIEARGEDGVRRENFHLWLAGDAEFLDTGHEPVTNKGVKRFARL